MYNPKKYMSIKCAIEKRDKLYKTLKFIYKFFPFILFIAYPLLILYLLTSKDIRVIKVVIVPAVTFLGCTVYRKIVNRERPYEKYNITPLFPKDTKGKSFPSRHTVSSFIISFAFMYINTGLGIGGIILSLVLSFLRPIAGVHYISDILGGILFSVVFALIGFCLI